jgi:geranylgeranyl diphosphate synthase type II
MVLAISEMFGANQEIALKVGMALEVFHNFTLIHDDIMDGSNLRRGKPTVHIKYGLNNAILSGDVMMIHAYQYILDIKDASLVKSLLDVFNKMAIEVCEGQQMDVDYESKSDVTIDEYIKMITLKTSVLIAAAAQMGAILGGADISDQSHIYKFALNFGIAFQLQDDILDTFGDEQWTGKKNGGDIVNNKKTYLYIKSLELASDEQKNTLKYYYSIRDNVRDDEKIDTVKGIFSKLLVKEYAKVLIESYRDLCISHLEATNVSLEDKQVMRDFVNQFIFRNR